MAQLSDPVAGDDAEVRLTSIKAALRRQAPAAGMKRALLLLTLPLALSAGSTPAATLAHGEALVTRHCGGCHATARDDRSREPAAPQLRELNRRYDTEQLGEALAEGLLVGHPMMPQFRFPAEDVKSILLYLKSIQTREGG
jgi:cytochrome c